MQWVRVRAARVLALLAIQTLSNPRTLMQLVQPVQLWQDNTWLMGVQFPSSQFTLPLSLSPSLHKYVYMGRQFISCFISVCILNFNLYYWLIFDASAKICENCLWICSWFSFALCNFGRLLLYPALCYYGADCFLISGWDFFIYHTSLNSLYIWHLHVEFLLAICFFFACCCRCCC